jgi:hypothetical protein
MVRDFPEVVGMVVDSILDYETFQDYRIIGNKYGTTIVMRYRKMDVGSGPRHSPLWRHRSMVNLTRDQARHNMWLRNNSSNGGCLTQDVENNVYNGAEYQNAVDAHTSSANNRYDTWSNGIDDREPMNHIWNTEAPEFNVKSAPVYKESEMQTEIKVDSLTKETQTEQINKMVSSGTQCEVEKRSIGIKCNLVSAKQSKYIQATAAVRSQGVSATVTTKEISTQCTKSKGASTSEVGVWCKQAPGAMGRHVQTVVKTFLEATTSTEPVYTETVGTETDGESRSWGDVMELGSFQHSEPGSVSYSDAESEDSRVEEAINTAQSRVEIGRAHV